MKTRPILRFIASIVVVAFISTQCGLGASQAYASDKAQNLRQETVEANAKAGGIGKELGVPSEASAVGNKSKASMVIPTVVLGAGLLLSNINAVPTQAMPSAAQAAEKPTIIMKIPVNQTAKAVDEEVINQLIGKLALNYNVNTFKEHEKAQKALIEIGKPAVSALIDAAMSKDKNLQKGAIDILGDIGDNRAVSVLIEIATENKEVEVQLNAIEALGKIGDKKALFVIMKTLKDRDKGVRYAAIDALIEISDYRDQNGMKRESSEVSDLVHGLLKAELPTGFGFDERFGGVNEYRSEGRNASSNEIDGRASMAKKLGDIQNPRAIYPLIAALSIIEDYKITYTLYRYYDGVGGSIPRHTEILSEKTAYVSTEDALGEVTKALVKIGKPAIPALMEALNNKNKNVRFYAAVALGMIGDERTDIGIVKILKPATLNPFTSKQKSQLAQDALNAIKSRLTSEQWSGANKEFLLSEGLKIGGVFLLAAIISLYYILRKKLSRKASGSNDGSSSGAGIPKQKTEVVEVLEAATDANVKNEEASASGTPTKAGAIGTSARAKLYLMTGVLGLGQTDVFKNASKDEISGFVKSIRDLRRALSAKKINPSNILKYGVPIAAQASKTPEEFEDYLSTLKSLAQNFSHHSNLLTKKIVEDALTYGMVKYNFVYHQATYRVEEIHRPAYDGGPDYERVVDKEAYFEAIPVEESTGEVHAAGTPTEAGAIGIAELQKQLATNISAMQATVPENSGIVFTPGVASLGLNVLVSQMNVPNRVLTTEETTQLTDEKLQQIATELKVDTVKLCKLTSEEINALTSDIIAIDPTQITAQIVEILKRFGITFDNTDPAKAEAARKAYEAAAAIAKSV